MTVCIDHAGELTAQAKTVLSRTVVKQKGKYRIQNLFCCRVMSRAHIEVFVLFFSFNPAGQTKETERLLY